MDVHNAIEIVQKELGYKVSPIGSCQGFSLRWLEACLLREEHIFDARIHKIVNELDTIGEAIKKAQAKPIKELTALDMQLLEIPAFYVSLGLYQMPEDYVSLFGTLYSQTDVKKISTLASSEKILALGGLDDFESGIYGMDEFKGYLDNLEQLIKWSDFSSEDVVGVVLSSSVHTNALTYTRGAGWKFMDINTYPANVFSSGSTSELIHTINRAFSLISDANYIAFGVTVFTVGLQKEKNQLFKKLLGSLKTQHSQSRVIPEAEKAIYLAEIAAINGDASLITQLYTESSLSIKNEEGVTMHYLAAKNGHANVIDALGMLGIDLDEKNEDGETAVFIAAINNNAQVIKMLAYYHADLNVLCNQKSAIYAASYLGHLESINALAENHANLNLMFNEYIPPPIFIAIEKGQTKALASLLNYGADVNLKYKGFTLLFYAAMLGNTEVVQQLIKHSKTDLDMSCINSLDALSATSGLMERDAILRMINFVSKQSDLHNIKVTARDIALISGHDEIVTLIEQEQDKRTNQKMLQKHSFRFYENQNTPLKKRGRQHLLDEEPCKYLC